MKNFLGKFLFLLVILCCFIKFSNSQTDSGMTMQFLFDGSATNTGTLSGSTTLTTIGSPTLNSAVSAVSGKKSVFFNNPNKALSMSTNYYRASNTQSIPMTIMLWLKTDLSYYMTVMGLHHTDCDGSITYSNRFLAAFQLDIDTSGSLMIHLNLPSQWSSLSTTIQANTWTHIAFTVSPTYVAKLYKNGIYIGQTTGTNNFPSNTFQSLFIGGSGDCFRGFHGYIQDLRMYNRALQVEEILFIYNAFMCVGNTYFNRQSNTCDPYFSDGVIGDAPWGIWRAQSYDAGSPLVLKESRGNGRDITISGTIVINNTTGNGALNPVYSLQGGTSSTMLWPTELIGDFTICSITRYTGGSNQRILAAINHGNWFHGHWGYWWAMRGVAHHDDRVTLLESRGTLTDWLVMCGQSSASNSDPAPNNIIADGVSIGSAVGGGNVRISINMNPYNEYSDWGFSDVVVWNRVLPYAEMKKVSDAMLKSVCGSSHYWNSVTNVCTACPVGLLSTGSGCPCNQTAGYYVNSVTNVCAACQSGWMSTGSGCLCNQSAGYYVKPVTNVCTSCPVRSSSTGSRCICVGKGNIWDSRSNTCSKKKKIYKDFFFMDL